MIAGPARRKRPRARPRRRKRGKRFETTAPTSVDAAAPVDPAPDKATVRAVWQQYVVQLRGFVDQLQAGALPSDTARPAPPEGAPGRRLKAKVGRWLAKVATARKIARNLEVKAAADAAWRAGITDGTAAAAGDAPPPPPTSDPAPVYDHVQPAPIDTSFPAPDDLVPDPLLPGAPAIVDPTPPATSDEADEGVPTWAWWVGGAAVVGVLLYTSRKKR